MCQTKNENKQDVGLLLLSSSVGTVAFRKSPYATRCATTSENSLDFSERDTLTAVSSVWHGHHNLYRSTFQSRNLKTTHFADA